MANSEDNLKHKMNMKTNNYPLSAGSLTTMDAWKEATGFTGGTFGQAKELFGRMTREQQRKVVGSMIHAAKDKTVIDPGKWAALVNSVKPAQ